MQKNDYPNFIYRFYKKHASVTIVIFFGIVYLINQAIILIILAPLEHDPLLLQLTFSKSVFSDLIVKWGEHGLQIYKSHYYFDFPHALIYAVFLSSAIAYLTYKPDKRVSLFHLILFALPYVAGLCDAIENTLHLVIIPNMYEISEVFIIFSAVMASTKWIFAGISILVIVYFFIQKKRQE